MKNERIAIMCNGVVPGSNIPSGAQGLRARGLQLGLDALGFDVDIVSKSNVAHVSMNRWKAPSIRIPKYWRLLHGNHAPIAINRDYGAVIMLNWATMPEFRPNDDVHLIYDFFSATMIEHSFITDEKTLQERRKKKLAALRHATSFIGNGTGRAEYGKAFLLENGLGDHNVASVRLTLEHQPRNVDKDGQFKIFAGGFDQAWTQGVTPEILAEIAREFDADICTIGLGRNIHAADSAAKLDALENQSLSKGQIVAHPPMRAKSYDQLNASSHVALDVFHRNIEREVSYSTRAVNALSNGCPLITMSFTEIGALVKELECGWVLDEFSVEGLIALLREIESDRDEVERRAANTKHFREKYGDPATEAQSIAELLK